MKCIIRNHSGACPMGTPYDEAEIINDALVRWGHTLGLLPPSLGFNGSIASHDEVIITTQPGRHTPLIEAFVRTHRAARLYWRVGWAQAKASFIREICATGQLRVMHVCGEKARQITGMPALTESACEISRWCQHTLVVGSDPTGAVACHNGEGIRVPVLRRIDHPMNTDGLGGAFFGGLLGSLWRQHGLPNSLAAGHRAAAYLADHGWEPAVNPASFTQPPAPVSQG